MSKRLSLLCYLLWVLSCGDIAPYSEHNWNPGCDLLVLSGSQITTSATHEHMLIKCLTNHHLCYLLTHADEIKETHPVCDLRDEPSFASHFVASIKDKGNGQVLSPLWASLPPPEQRQRPFPEWTVMAVETGKQLAHSGTQLKVGPLLCPKMSVVLGDCLPEDGRQICF